MLTIMDISNAAAMEGSHASNMALRMVVLVSPPLWSNYWINCHEIMICHHTMNSSDTVTFPLASP